jgi:hypothetical protein
MLRGMPAAAVMQPTINSALGAPGSSNYERGKSAVVNSDKLLRAVEAGGLLDGLSPAQQQEVRDILRGMPDDVDSQFMAAVRGALNGNKRVRFNWEAHPTNGYDHTESTDPADGATVVLTLRTPPGTAH